MSVGDFPESLSQAMLVGCNVSREIGRNFGYARRQAGDGHGRRCVDQDFAYIYIYIHIVRDR